jgi:hypothetical protein
MERRRGLLCGHLVALDLKLEPADLLANVSQQGAQFDPAFGPRSAFEDGPDFGFGASTGLRGTHTQSSVGFLGQVADGD